MRAALVGGLLLTAISWLPADARTKPGPKTIRGVVTHLSRGGFTLHTKTRGSFSVGVSPNTSITEKGKKGRLTVREGDHVGVRGFISGHHIRAISVHIYPTKPKPYTVTGTVAAVSSQEIDLRTSTIVVRAAITSRTTIRIGSRAGSFIQIRVGDRAGVRVQRSGNRLVALHIHIYRHKQAGRKVELSGTIVAAGAGTISLRSGSRQYTVRITLSTRVYRGSARTTAAALRMGETVRVYACCAGSPLTASSVHIRKTKTARVTMVLRGTVTSVASDHLVLSSSGGVSVIWLSSSTTYEVGAAKIRRSGVLVGDHVSVRAYRSGGRLIATRVHVYAQYRRPRTIVGVVVAASGGSITVRARGKRYTVRWTSATTISLNGKPVAAGRIRVGDHVRITGRVNGSTIGASRIRARRLPPPVRLIRGTIAGISGRNLAIVDSVGQKHAVRLASGAKVLWHGRTAPTGALFVGVRAAARGVMSGNTLLASTLSLSVEARTLTGTLHSVRPKLLLLSIGTRRVTVDLAPKVLITDSARHISLSSLHAGGEVRVRGFGEGKNRLRATRVRVLHPAVSLAGTVATVSPRLTVRTSQGVSYGVDITPSTAVSTGREQVTLAAQEIPEGARVHVWGKLTSDGSIGATRIEVHLAAVTLRGTISDIAGEELILSVSGQSIRVRAGSSTSLLQGSRPLGMGDLVVGDDVTVYGYQAAGVVLARKILVHRKLVALDGRVQSQSGDGFVLETSSGPVRVIVSTSTTVTGQIAVGAAAHVTGYRRGDGVILATKVKVGKR